MNHLPSSILNLLGFNVGRRYGRGRDDEEDEDEKSDMTDMVKKLVMDQHRTMFYTVTLSPVNQTKNPENNNSKVIAPSLKWQCASSLSKSRILLARTNSNSNKYYNLTFIDTDTADSDADRENIMNKSKSFSPVKIYIET